MSKKKFYETDEFKKMDAEWSKKLKDSGFNDIETASDREKNSVHKQEFRVNFEYLEYNRQCLIFLNSGSITDPLDYFIFEKHCDGISVRETEILLNETDLKKITFQSIHRRISRLLSAAQIKPITFSF